MGTYSVVVTDADEDISASHTLTEEGNTSHFTATSPERQDRMESPKHECPQRRARSHRNE